MQRRSGKRILQTSVSIVLALSLLVFFFRQVSFRELVGLLRSLGFAPILWAVALALASYTARAFRWGLILSPVGKAPFSTLLGCTFAGFATSSVLPARLGELVRPLLLSSRAHLPTGATLASIIAERLLDLATVVSLALLALLWRSQAQQRLVATFLWVAGGVLALGLFLMLVVRRRAAFAEFLARKAKSRFSQKLAGFLQEILNGLAFWGRPSHAALLGLWSLVTWGLVLAQVAVTGRAFHHALSPGQATLVLAISVVGLAVPTPGGVGGFHAAIQFALVQVVGWPVATATAYALVHHAICFVPVTLAGIGYMLAVGASWRALSERPASES
ncbi:MAG: lysylphosphatidylglycerol synthase transmembrane domain-containing protein [Thermoanaerobaculaceae bacterium]